MNKPNDRLQRNVAELLVESASELLRLEWDLSNGRRAACSSEERKAIGVVAAIVRGLLERRPIRPEILAIEYGRWLEEELAGVQVSIEELAERYGEGDLEVRRVRSQMALTRAKHSP